ncbi:hypothetical protein ACOMHN_020481 [Nucella lapillus]
MRTSDSSACFSLYFTALAVSDQCQLLTVGSFYLVDMIFSWPASWFRYHLFCFVPNFIWSVCGMTSSWCLVAMTYQRVMSVLTPYGTVLTSSRD